MCKHYFSSENHILLYQVRKNNTLKIIFINFLLRNVNNNLDMRNKTIESIHEYTSIITKWRYTMIYNSTCDGSFCIEIRIKYAHILKITFCQYYNLLVCKWDLIAFISTIKRYFEHTVSRRIKNMIKWVIIKKKPLDLKLAS